MLSACTRIARRGFRSAPALHAKVLAACFSDPLSGYPPPRVRASLPDIRYGCERARARAGPLCLPSFAAVAISERIVRRAPTRSGSPARAPPMP